MEQPVKLRGYRMFALPGERCFSLTVMPAQPKCPKCGSVIYSRRHPVCGRCGAKLSESLMFDATTRARLDKLAEDERQQAEWERKFPGHPSSSGEFGSML